MDDKKKIMVMGALVVVVVGIGAFQMTSGGLSGPQEKKSPAKEAVAAKDDPAKAQAEKAAETPNPLFAKDLPERDPFKEGVISNSVQPPATQPTGKQLVTRRSQRPGNIVPPFDPTGNLPAAFEQGKTSLQGAAAIRPPDQFAMTVSGVIMGSRPAAIFQDDQGNQRLVALGGAVDGDSRVTGISQGKVTVSHKGKTVTLTVGANTDGK